MANVAFNTAQCTDPSYAQAWIGQATIAEMFGHEEAMDLYRHSHELGAHVSTIVDGGVVWLDNKIYTEVLRNLYFPG